MTCDTIILSMTSRVPAGSLAFMFKKKHLVFIREDCRTFMSRTLILLGAAVAAGLLLAAVSFSAPNSAAQTGGMNQQGQGPMNMGDMQNHERPAVQLALNKKFMDYENGVFKVRAGAGSHVAPLTLFFPNHAEIKVGETVLFYNPTLVSEPHTVTFIRDNSAFADFVGPFVLENQTALTPVPPGANSEPILMPGPEGKTVIIAANNRSISPTIVDSTGNATYLQPNANYTMTGTEKYVNSGWMWPKDLTPPGLPPIESFAVTFNEEGTYNYICVVHPWMTGEVVVK